jgi:hypothetical protein
MPKAKEFYTMNRRALLSTITAGVAAGATAAVPAIALPVDPVRRDRPAPKYGNPHRGGPQAVCSPNTPRSVETIRAKARAALALIDTAPTTRAGLRALEASSAPGQPRSSVH